jgi:D-threo-aldose 1-dehydrogenase
LMIDTLGLGGAPLGGNFVDLNYNQAAELIRAARDAGISYFDTAPWYGFGRSERVMGDVLRGTDYALSDKVGRLLKPGAVSNPMSYGMIDPLPFHVVYDYGYDGIMRACEDSLQRLGLDRIDILLAHDIGTFQHGEENARHFRDLAEGGYRAMDELRKSGQIKVIPAPVVRQRRVGGNSLETGFDQGDIGD